MARLFKDGAGTTYDATVAKFFSVPFGYTANTDTPPVQVVNPNGAYEPFNFVNTTNLLAQADMTAAANAFDCGECHVGGGTMDYLPGSRVNLRDIETSSDVPGGPLAGKVTAFNYFIDQYDIGGVAGEKFEALHIDYNQTGTVEMDCFMCHLTDYQFEDRKAAIRAAKFDATRPVGAGIAAATAKAYGTAGYGTTVVYNASKLVFANGTDDTAGYKLASSVTSAINATPPTANCSSCHMEVHAVDWKKRGDDFTTNTDVHYNIGCMGCHERKDKSVATIGTSGNFVSGADKALLGMCDPAKGGASPFEALAQQLDNSNFKNCVGCHSPGAKTYSTFGAKDPTAAHTSKGLTDHLAYISCEACHVKKTNATTGGHIVDGTGVDHEGRVADHEHNPVLDVPLTGGANSERLHIDSNDVGQTDRVAMMWNENNTKLHPVNLHTSFFIRSKNDRAVDLNADGRTGGADSIMQSHMAEVTGWNADSALFADGVVTETEIGLLFTAIEGRFGSTTATANLNGKAAPTGAAAGAPGYSDLYPRLSFMTVPFKSAHNIGQSYQAWGAGGCTDCHGLNKGFYNKAYDLTGGYELGWNKTSQMTPMTKVNGFSQATYTHPNVKDKWTGRSIAVDPVSSTGMRNPDRSEFLYESTFLTLNPAWQTQIVGTAIAFPAAPASFGGSVLKLVVNNATTTRTFSATSSPSNVAGLMTAFGTFATAHEFTITGSGNVSTELVCVPATGVNCTGITITAKDANLIKLAGNADGASYGLMASQYVSKPRTPAQQAVFDAANNTTNGVATTRAQWVSYLNAIGTAVAPQASIAEVAGSSNVNFAKTIQTAVQVTKDVEVTLEANTPVATGAVTYSWYCSDNGAVIADGATATRTFTKLGTFLCTLTATTDTGVTRENIYVKVVAPYVAPADQPVKWVAGAGFVGNLSVTGMPAHTKITVAWGDLTATTTVNAAGDHTVAHTFKPVSSRLVTVGTVQYYRYPVTVRVYNGATQVKTISLKVDIAKP